MTVVSAASTPDLARAQAAGAPRDIAAAIGNASRRTGVDFAYLLAQARQESSFQADVKAATSSATGLYQFIEQTWLGTVKEHGANHGLGAYADLIETDSGGRHSIADPSDRRAVLALRKDPQIASLMAAEHARENGLALQLALGRDVTATDLYMAHFLGVEGAREFLTAREADGGQPGAELLPKAAHANRGVFYDPSGRPRTVAEIYDRFAAKFEAEQGGPMLAAADRGGPWASAVGNAAAGSATGMFAAAGAAAPWRPGAGMGIGEAAMPSAGPYALGADRTTGNSILTRARLAGSGAAPLVPAMRPEAFLAVAALQEIAADLGAAPARAGKAGRG